MIAQSLCSGRIGGTLFQCFLHMTCSREVVKTCTTADAEFELSGSGPRALNLELMEIYMPKFYMWLVTLTSSHQQSRRHRYGFTMTLKLHGLSRTGISLLSKTGVCQSLTSFDRQWAVNLTRQGSKLRYRLFIYVAPFCNIQLSWWFYVKSGFLYYYTNI
jgi:hypothetical protein